MNIDKDFYKNADKLLEDLFRCSEEDICETMKTSKSLNKKKKKIKLIFNELKIVTMTINAILPMIINYIEFRGLICDMIHKENKSNILFTSIQYKSENGDDIIIGAERKKLIQFYNCFTLKILVEDKNTLNFKYFKNGSIQITGCKDIADVEKTILHLIDIIKTYRHLLKYDIKVIKNKKLQFLDKLKVKELKKIGEENGLLNCKKNKKEYINSKNFDRNWL